MFTFLRYLRFEILVKTTYSGWWCCSVVSSSLATPWTIACQAPLSMQFLGQEYWNRLPFPSPGIFPIQGSKLHFLHWQEDSLPLSHLASLHFLQREEQVWRPWGKNTLGHVCPCSGQTMESSVVETMWARQGWIRGYKKNKTGKPIPIYLYRNNKHSLWVGKGSAHQE